MLGCSSEGVTTIKCDHSLFCGTALRSACDVIYGPTEKQLSLRAGFSLGFYFKGLKCEETHVPSGTCTGQRPSTMVRRLGPVMSVIFLLLQCLQCNRLQISIWMGKCFDAVGMGHTPRCCVDAGYQEH